MRCENGVTEANTNGLRRHDKCLRRFFYPLSVIILNPYSVLTSDISLSDIAEDVAGYIIKSCEEQWRQPSRDAKSCVSRTTNVAITATSSPQVIAHPCVSRTKNAATTATSSPLFIDHPCISRTKNTAITVTSSPLFIAHPYL